MSVIQKDHPFSHPGWEILFFGSEVVMVVAYSLFCSIDGGYYPTTLS